MSPTVALYLKNGGVISNQEFEFVYKFPLFRLFDFWMGMVFAELVEEAHVKDFFTRFPWMPDATAISLTVFLCTVQLVPCDLSAADPASENPLYRTNGETFLVSGFAPVLCFLLLGYSCNSLRGAKLPWTLATLLEAPVFESFGSICFSIYCFQFSFYFMFETWQHKNTGIDAIFVWEEVNPPQIIQLPARLIAPYFLIYFIVLACFSFVWTRYCEQPVAKALAVFSKKHFEKGFVKRNGLVEEGPHSVTPNPILSHVTAATSLDISKASNGQSGIAALSISSTLTTALENGYFMSRPSPLTSVGPAAYRSDGCLSSSKDFDGYMTDMEDDETDYTRKTCVSITQGSSSHTTGHSISNSDFSEPMNGDNSSCMYHTARDQELMKALPGLCTVFYV